MSRGPFSQSEASSRDSDQSEARTSVPSRTQPSGRLITTRRENSDIVKLRPHIQFSDKSNKLKPQLKLNIGYLCWKRVNGIFHFEIFKSFLVEDSGIMLQEELI